MKKSALLFILAVLVVPVHAQIEKPILASAQLPLYPDMAREARVQGTVILNVTISPEGRVLAAKKISGSPLLGKAAEENVRTWIVRWPSVSALPKKSVQRNVEFVFKLSDESAPAHSPFVVTVSGIDRVEIDANAFPIQTIQSEQHP
jgi:TonB family protein